MAEENNAELVQKKDELVNEIKTAIDDLSNLKSLRQLAKENMKVKQYSDELEKKAKVQEYRLEQAKSRMKKIRNLFYQL